MRSKRVIVFAGVGLLLASVSAWAHHAFAAEFDVKKPIHFTGVVTKLELVNPHAWIHIDVKGPDGQVASWMIEAGTPNVLLRRGFGRDLTLPDGRKLFIGASGAEGPDEGHKK